MYEDLSKKIKEILKIFKTPLFAELPMPSLLKIHNSTSAGSNHKNLLDVNSVTKPCKIISPMYSFFEAKTDGKENNEKLNNEIFEKNKDSINLKQIKESDMNKNKMKYSAKTKPSNFEKDDGLITLRRNKSARVCFENKIFGSFSNKKDLLKYFITPVNKNSRGVTPELQRNSRNGTQFTSEFIADPDENINMNFIIK